MKSLVKKFTDAVNDAFARSPKMVYSNQYQKYNEAEDSYELGELQFVRTNIKGCYKGQLKQSIFGSTFHEKVVDYGPTLVRLEDIPSIIEDWDENFGRPTGRMVRSPIWDRAVYYKELKL